MPVISSRDEPSTGADLAASPSVDTRLAPNREEKRRIRLWGGERTKQFAARLKANARWLKQFLHGGK